MPCQSEPLSKPLSFLSADDRAAVTSRAVAAATLVARNHGIKVDGPVVLADGYAVRVHLRPAPVVARVSTYTAILRDPIAPWLARELEVTSFLASQGAPVVPPSDLLPCMPFEQDGFGISFWTYVQQSTSEPPSAEVTGRMLGELHEAMRGYPGQLPFLAPAMSDIRSGLDRIQRNNLLPPEDLDMLRRAADRLVPRLEAMTAPRQPLHGDAHPYNLIPTSRGPLWNDFEDVCFGPIAWDLNTLSDPEGKMLANYSGAPAPEDLALCCQARMVQAAAFVYGLLPEHSDYEPQGRYLLEMVRKQR